MGYAMSRPIIFSATFLALGFLITVTACEPAVGDSCKSSNDCPSGTACDTYSPKGYCLSAGCEFSDDCPQDSVCIEFAKNTTFCLAPCETDKDCRSGYKCRDDRGEVKFCYLPKSEDSAFGREEENAIPFGNVLDESHPDKADPSQPENGQGN